MEKRTIVIGQMDNSKDHTLESANRVYGKQGCSPTLNTVGGGGLQPKVIKQVNVIGGTGNIWGTQYRQQAGVIDKKQVAYAIVAGANVNSVVKHYEHRN